MRIPRLQEFPEQLCLPTPSNGCFRSKDEIRNFTCASDLEKLQYTAGNMNKSLHNPCGHGCNVHGLEKNGQKKHKNMVAESIMLCSRKHHVRSMVTQMVQNSVSFALCVQPYLIPVQ